jgi:hypothetical protein
MRAAVRYLSGYRWFVHYFSVVARSLFFGGSLREK